MNRIFYNQYEIWVFLQTEYRTEPIVHFIWRHPIYDLPPTVKATRSIAISTQRVFRYWVPGRALVPVPYPSGSDRTFAPLKRKDLGYWPFRPLCSLQDRFLENCSEMTRRGHGYGMSGYEVVSGFFLPNNSLCCYSI